MGTLNIQEVGVGTLNIQEAGVGTPNIQEDGEVLRTYRRLGWAL